MPRPQTDMEKRLDKIWSELFEITDLATHIASLNHQKSLVELLHSTSYKTRQKAIGEIDEVLQAKNGQLSTKRMEIAKFIQSCEQR